MQLAKEWLDDAMQQRAQRNPNAMTLASVDSTGTPSARIVLCKEFVADPGYLVFYTNYRSRKGLDIAERPHVALVMHWDSLGRQVRIEGQAVMSPADESDRYFATRDRGSQLGAWGSDQSQPIASREAFATQVEQRAARFDDVVQRPPHWGGFRVWASAVELWIEGADRIHDRARWTRNLQPSGDASFSSDAWEGVRLQP